MVNENAMGLTARLKAVAPIYNVANKFSKPAMDHLVTRPGFEPRQAESESAVLPLYYRAIY